MNLEKFVATDVHYNGQEIGMSGYRDMLEGNYRDIPDLHFTGDLLICQSPYVASRPLFDCTPVAVFLGLAVNGRRVKFSEHVFHRSTTARSTRSGRSSTGP